MNELLSRLLYFVAIAAVIAGTMCIFNTMMGDEINWYLNITVGVGVSILWTGLSLLASRRKAKEAKTERTAIKHMSKAEKKAFKDAEVARYERAKQEREDSALEYEDTVEVEVIESKKKGKDGKKKKETTKWTTTADDLAAAQKIVEKQEKAQLNEVLKQKPGKAKPAEKK